MSLSGRERAEGFLLNEVKEGLEGEDMSLSGRERAEGFLLNEVKEGLEVERSESSSVLLSVAKQGSGELVSPGVRPNFVGSVHTSHPGTDD